MNLRPDLLSSEAEEECYQYFDQHIRKLPKKSNGTFDESDSIFVNSDVDAFRHAYVSGVFTHEYGEKAADYFGRLNELTSPFSAGGEPREKNMDLWNNAVGRKYGLKYRTRDSLKKQLYQALKRGEMILTPDDKREYLGATHMPIDSSKPIIVLQESVTGANEIFYDTDLKIAMFRKEFVKKILAGDYLGYSTRIIDGVEVPGSKPDDSESGNLG